MVKESCVNSKTPIGSLLHISSPFVPMETSMKKRSNALYVIVIIALVVLVVLLDAKRREALKVAQQTTLSGDQTAAGQAQNREAAMRIVAEVRKLYSLSDGVEPTVATIVDVNELRKRNAFYNKAENGDYLIVTTDRAILYDAEKNLILDVVPVQIQPAAQGDQPAQ